MKLIDTHTHLFAKEFNNDRDTIISNAINEGVEKMILPAIDSQQWALQFELHSKFPENCFSAIGIHPSDINSDYEKEIQLIEENLNKKNVVAIGETGIDLYWDKTYKEEQKKAFEFHVELAKKHSLPIIIHVRNAFDEVLEITDKHNDGSLYGVFHSFTGNIKQAEKILEYGGFKIGINGIVTFKNSGLDKIVKKIDIENILLETDSPYLSPVPKRGRRNESSHLILIAEKISEIKNIDINTVAEITTKSAYQLFTRLP